MATCNGEVVEIFSAARAFRDDMVSLPEFVAEGIGEHVAAAILAVPIGAFAEACLFLVPLSRPDKWLTTSFLTFGISLILVHHSINGECCCWPDVLISFFPLLYHAHAAKVGGLELELPILTLIAPRVPDRTDFPSGPTISPGAKVNATASLAGNPVNFPHLARVGPLYDKKVSRPESPFSTQVRPTVVRKRTNNGHRPASCIKTFHSGGATRCAARVTSRPRSM